MGHGEYGNLDSNEGNRKKSGPGTGIFSNAGGNNPKVDSSIDSSIDSSKFN